MNIPVPALKQSYLRTKAQNYAEYKKTMELHANSSNNTIFVDGDGDIAYWQGTSFLTAIRASITPSLSTAAIPRRIGKD